MPSLTTRLFLALALILPSAAEVNTIRHFRLGEGDSAAAAGAIATSSADSSGLGPMEPLIATAGALYSADVANGNSRLSMDFDGTQYATTGNWNVPATDFGVELWVKPDQSGGEGVIVYTGNPGADGWGIIENGTTGTFSALFGGKVVFGAGAMVVGQWTHLAFVCTGTSSTFYINGVASSTSVEQLPGAQGLTMRLAAAPADPPATFFKGKLDELRIFTFAPGAFTPADLLCNLPPVPPVLVFHRVGNQDNLTWPTWNDSLGRGLETTTDLLAGPWTPVNGPAEFDGLFSITVPSADPARFYRLQKPGGTIAPPLLPEGKFIVIANGVTPKNVTNLGAANANRINGAVNAKIDASAFIDPATGTGGVDALAFHWVITYPQNPDQPFTDRGTTGYRQPVLSFIPNALVLQPDPADTAGLGAKFSLTVTSRLTGLTTVVDLQAQVVSSQLTLTLYNECQTELNACGTCDCTIEAALPVLSGEDT